MLNFVFYIIPCSSKFTFLSIHVVASCDYTAQTVGVFNLNSILVLTKCQRNELLRNGVVFVYTECCFLKIDGKIGLNRIY